MSKKTTLPTLDEDSAQTSEKPTQSPAELMPKVELPSFVYAAVPEDRALALKMACEGVFDTIRHTCLRYWNIGRIMSTLEGRGEKDIVTDLMQMSKLEERTVRYTLAFYRRFTNIEKVVQLSDKGIGWSQFKQLAAISKDTDREKIVNSVLSDKLTPELLDDTVEKLKTAEKKDKDKDKSDKPKKAAAVKFFGKLCRELQDAAGHNYEMKAELVSFVEMLGDDERVSDAECKQCIAFAKDSIKAIASIQDGLTDMTKQLQDEVVTAYADPVKPVKSKATDVSAKGSPEAKPAAGK